MDKEELLDMIAQWTSTAYSDTMPFVMKTKKGVALCWLHVIVDKSESCLSVEVGRLLGLYKTGEVSILSNKPSLITVDNSKDGDFNCCLSQDEYYDELIKLYDSNTVSKENSFGLLRKVFPESICSVIEQYTSEFWEA